MLIAYKMDEKASEYDDARIMKSKVTSLINDNKTNETENCKSEDFHDQKSSLESETLFLGDNQTTDNLDDNISALTERITRLEKHQEVVLQKLVDVKQTVDVTDNVNNNFRKILKLENEFLRELNKEDRETISCLQKRIQILKSKLFEFGARTGLSRTEMLALVDIREDRHQISNGVASVKSAYPFFFGVSELLRQGFTKDDILQIIDRTRTPKTSTINT